MYRNKRNKKLNEEKMRSFQRLDIFCEGKDDVYCWYQYKYVKIYIYIFTVAPIHFHFILNPKKGKYKKKTENQKKKKIEMIADYNNRLKINKRRKENTKLNGNSFYELQLIQQSPKKIHQQQWRAFSFLIQIKI